MVKVESQLTSLGLLPTDLQPSPPHSGRHPFPPGRGSFTPADTGVLAARRENAAPAGCPDRGRSPLGGSPRPQAPGNRYFAEAQALRTQICLALLLPLDPTSVQLPPLFSAGGLPGEEDWLKVLEV
ncbi:hypothetical protein VULLAG_LOCUS21003 [Vulpes lagopus]